MKTAKARRRRDHMKRMRQFASLIAAAAMVVTSVPMNGWTVQAQAATTPSVRYYG